MAVRSGQRAAPVRAQTAQLDEGRYKALLTQAAAFFAHSERDVGAEKAQVIREIKALMGHYQLTLQDIED